MPNQRCIDPILILTWTKWQLIVTLVKNIVIWILLILFYRIKCQRKLGITIIMYVLASYLIVIDDISKYFELAQLPNASSDTVITHLRSIFAPEGIFKAIFSDNGSHDSWYEFKKSKSWSHLHKAFSPEFPRSKSFVERAIQTIN